MEFNQVIMTRRSVFKFESQAVLLADVLPLLTAAIMAPNHGLTQPWQFLWVGEQTRSHLAQYYGHARALKKCAADTADFAEHKLRAVARFMAIPAIVIVVCRVDANPIVAQEDYAATCCAIQNLLLAATDNGLGAQWSTHPMIRDKLVLALLGLDETQTQIVSMLYLGYPAVIPASPPRKTVDSVLTVLP